MNGSGALVVLRASSRKALSEDQLEAAPAWTRWRARLDSERRQRRSGWAIIGLAVVIALLRLLRAG